MKVFLWNQSSHFYWKLKNLSLWYFEYFTHFSWQILTNTILWDCNCQRTKFGLCFDPLKKVRNGAEATPAMYLVLAPFGAEQLEHIFFNNHYAFDSIHLQFNSDLVAAAQRHPHTVLLLPPCFTERGVSADDEAHKHAFLIQSDFSLDAILYRSQR